MLSVGHFIVAPVVVADDYGKKKQREGTREAPLVGVDAHVELIDYCAEITLTQRFRNDEESALEVSFEFELPKGCAISSFSADVGDRHLTGKVQEKQKAEDRYDDALAAGHSAVLLEAKEEDPNTFFVQLGNLAPGKEAFVSIKYEQLAMLMDDKIVLTLDGSDATNIIFAEPVPEKKPMDDPRVEPGFHFTVHVATKSPLKSISSPSHPILVELGEDGAKVRLSDGANWRENKDFVLEVAVADPHQPSVRIQKANDAKQMAMLSFYPKIDIPQTKCEMICLLDRSGSMAGSAIECAKSTLQFFLRSLPVDSYFNIVSFGGHFEFFSPESLPFNDDTLKAATSHVSSLKANLGGTNIYDPLSAIFSQSIKPGYPRQIFILTDGEVRNKDRCIDLVRQNVNTTRLFAFGIGSSVDNDLVTRMARAGEGRSCLIRDVSSICENVMKQIEYALQPGLTDIHITWNDATTGKPLPENIIRQTPANLPTIFRGSRLVAFALLPDDLKPCKVFLTGSFGDSQFTSEVEVNPASVEKIPGEQIIKLGVRSLIEDIQNGCGGIPSNNRDEIQKAVIDLSVKYGVLSKYTAFIAVGSGGEALETSMITRRVSRRNVTEVTLDSSVMTNASNQNMDELRALLDSMDEDERRKLELDIGISQPFQIQSMGAVNHERDYRFGVQHLSLFDDEGALVDDISDWVVTEDMPHSRCRRKKLHERRAERKPSAKCKKQVVHQSEFERKPLPKCRRPELCERKPKRMQAEECESCGPKDLPDGTLNEFSSSILCGSFEPPKSAEYHDWGDPLAEQMNLEDVFMESRPLSPPSFFCSSQGSTQSKLYHPDSFDKTKSLDNVILHQKASGCFDAFALKLLDIPESAKNAKPSVLPDKMSSQLAEDVWITLLVVIGIQDKYIDKISEWMFLATKSINWVKEQLGAAFDDWKAAAEAAYRTFHS